jgi:hypothetical protein
MTWTVTGDNSLDPKPDHQLPRRALHAHAIAVAGGTRRDCACQHTDDGVAGASAVAEYLGLDAEPHCAESGRRGAAVVIDRRTHGAAATKSCDGRAAVKSICTVRDSAPFGWPLAPRSVGLSDYGRSPGRSRCDRRLLDNRHAATQPRIFGRKASQCLSRGSIYSKRRLRSRLWKLTPKASQPPRDARTRNAQS